MFISISESNKAVIILISSILYQYAESVAFKRPGALLSDDDLIDKIVSNERLSPRKAAERLYEQAEYRFYTHVLKPECKMSRVKGESSCLEVHTNSIMWYWDLETEECLAFRYNGCGEALINRFNSKRECEKRCRPYVADDNHCLGRKAPAMNENGEIISCILPNVKNSKISNRFLDSARMCPDGHHCVMMDFFGICCNIEATEIYWRNYRPSCANKKLPLQIKDELKNLNVTYFGKNCADDFCPNNSTCHQQEIFAYCCPK